jgi:hypothetical protein
MRPDTHDTPRTWAIVIFASRESLAVLISTIKAAQIAARGVAEIDVVVNGNNGLAVALTKQLGDPEFASDETPVKVWKIAVGDKANAWNQYLHQIWSGQQIAFFIDGYVRLNPDSVSLLGDSIANQVDVLGGTGIPNIEPSTITKSSQPAPESGFHGNFCCLTDAAIEKIRLQHICLPFGLYRVDSLMGAMLSVGFDPARNAWVGSRIYVHPAASWQTDSKHWWRISDIRAQIKRTFRQSRGVLENLAARDHLVVRKQPPEMMPATATELILEWVQRCPEQANKVLRYNPLARRALADIKQSAGKANAANNTAPILVGRSRQP